MNAKLENELDNYFKSINLKTIPKTDKEKLAILRNIANNCESELINLEENYNKSERNDENTNIYVNKIRNLEVGYLIARSFVLDVRAEIRKDRINSFKRKVKSIFKK